MTWMEQVSEKQYFGNGAEKWHPSVQARGVEVIFFSTGVLCTSVKAASQGCSRGSGEECLVNCDDHFPSPWIHWLRAVIFTQTAPLTMFTTINPVTIHGSLVTVRALV